MLVEIMSTYTDEVLNSFNPEPQLKDTGSTKRKTVKDFMTEFKGFKFATAMVLDFKK